MAATHGMHKTTFQFQSFAFTLLITRPDGHPVPMETSTKLSMAGARGTDNELRLRLATVRSTFKEKEQRSSQSGVCSSLTRITVSRQPAPLSSRQVVCSLPLMVVRLGAGSGR